MYISAVFWGSFLFGDDDDDINNRGGCKIQNEIETETNELNGFSSKKNHTKQTNTLAKHSQSRGKKIS